MAHSGNTPAQAGSLIVSHLSLQHALTPDTQVLTCKGEILARNLCVGDRIITRDFGAIALRGLKARYPRETQELVFIPAHAFGKNRPERPITVLADQPIVIRDQRAQLLYNRKQARVAAARLVDGTFVRGLKKDPGPMIALHFEKPAVVYANGLEIVSAGMDKITPKHA